jgi:hypothetical protein
VRRYLDEQMEKARHTGYEGGVGTNWLEAK